MLNRTIHLTKKDKPKSRVLNAAFFRNYSNQYIVATNLETEHNGSIVADDPRFIGIVGELFQGYCYKALIEIALLMNIVELKYFKGNKVHILSSS